MSETKPNAKTATNKSKAASTKTKSTTTKKTVAAKNLTASNKSKKPATKPNDVKVSDTKTPTKSKNTTNKTQSVSNKPRSKSTTAKKPRSTGKSFDMVKTEVKKKQAATPNSNMSWEDLEKRMESYESVDKKGKASTAANKVIDEDTTKPAREKKSPRDEVFRRQNSKPHKVIRVISWLLTILLGVSTVVLGGMIINIGFLPENYLVPVIAVLAVILLGFGLLMCLPKVKSGVKVPVFIFTGLFSVIYVLGISYLNKTFDFFGNLGGQEYTTEQYYVLVKKSSSYQNLKDLRGKSIETFDEGIEIYQSALEKLNSSVEANVQPVDSINTLSSDLLDDKADAIMISAVHKTALDEENETFANGTRSIHTIEIKVKNATEANHPDINIATEPFTIYISGSDAYGTISDRSRSDVNMLATVNPNTHEILLVSIPRDYYVALHRNGAMDKLTHAGIYGVQESMNTIADLLNIDIDFYVKVNFSTLVSIVDTIGGIEVYSDQTITPLHGGGKTIQKGNNHMDGQLALAFARERKSYATGDRHRVQNQQDVLKAIIKKVTSSTVILTKYGEILDDVSSSLETNLTKDDIAGLIKLQLKDMPSWQTGEYSLNGSDAYGSTYSFGSQQLYVMQPDQATVDAAHNYITGIIEGKTISELGLPQN